jgi:hypothetical protein
VDRSSRGIIVSLGIVVGFTILSAIAALFIPFNVEQPVTIRDVSGTVKLLSEGNDPVTFEEYHGKITLRPGQTLQVEPNSSATILFFDNGGRAFVTGPASLTLIEIHRRATGLNHILDPEQSDYVLTLEQTAGHTRYIFENATPSFEDTTITIRLPASTFTPSTACWDIDISADKTVSAGPAACPR